MDGLEKSVKKRVKSVRNCVTLNCDDKMQSCENNDAPETAALCSQTQKSVKNCVKSVKNCVKKFLCSDCDYTTSRREDYNRHILTRRHSQRIKSVKKRVDFNDEQSFHCSYCNYSTHNKAHFSKHNASKKHTKNVTMADVNHVEFHTEPLQATAVNNISVDRDIFIDLLKQTNDFKQFMLEQNHEMSSRFIEQTHEFKQLIIEQNNAIIELAKKDVATITNITNNKQRFNFNVFLNEKCKDAINMSEFIESITVDFNDLEYLGTQGYVSGITKLFLDKLNEMDIYKRPIHCTDLKREILHIKDNNEWTKDDEENTMMKGLIERIAHRNARLIYTWQEMNPQSQVADSKMYNLWMKIIKESINVGPQSVKNTKDVLSNIAKAVYIERGRSVIVL